MILPWYNMIYVSCCVWYYKCKYQKWSFSIKVTLLYEFMYYVWFICLTYIRYRQYTSCLINLHVYEVLRLNVWVLHVSPIGNLFYICFYKVHAIIIDGKNRCANISLCLYLHTNRTYTKHVGDTWIQRKHDFYNLVFTLKQRSEYLYITHVDIKKDVEILGEAYKRLWNSVRERWKARNWLAV